MTVRRQHTEKHTFYVPPSHFGEGVVAFPGEEAQHASRVLRLQAGNIVQVVDGLGGRFRVRIDEAKKARVLASVIESVAPAPELRVQVTLAVGLLKHAGRFETVLEKATELGVSRIVPLLSDRTEKPRLKRARSEGILVSAMKQSGRAVLPLLDEPTPLELMLRECTEGVCGLLCHESAAPSDSLRAALDQPKEQLLLAIGPEGGFTDGEVQQAKQSGMQVVSLGGMRLRTETAAIAAMAGVALLFAGTGHGHE